MEHQEILPDFGYYNKTHRHCNTLSLAAFPDTPFDLKLLLIGIVSWCQGYLKKVPILKIGEPAPSRPTPPVTRVILLQSEAVEKDLCPGTVCSI